MHIVVDLHMLSQHLFDEDTSLRLLDILESTLANNSEITAGVCISALGGDRQYRVLRRHFQHLHPRVQVHTWWPLKAVSLSAADLSLKRLFECRMRTAFLRALNPDVILVLIPENVKEVDLSNLDFVSNRCNNALCPELVCIRAEDVSEDLAKHMHSQNGVKFLFYGTPENIKLCRETYRENTDNIYIPISDNSSTAARLEATLRSLGNDSAPSGKQPLQLAEETRPELFYVSPLPPEKTGIADYSAELLPELSLYYSITVVTNQDEISSPWIRENTCHIRADEFHKTAPPYARVVYHIGNSAYHAWMLELLAEIPGTVVLHDFFLGDLHMYRQVHGNSQAAFFKALFESHGYLPAAQSLDSEKISDLIKDYPCSASVLGDAHAVILHSEYSRSLVGQWYGEVFARSCCRIPHLRAPVSNISRDDARKSLGFREQDFMVCSFGLVGPAKLNHELLRAWSGSEMAGKSNCFLVFVGGAGYADYAEEIKHEIQHNGLTSRVYITGWADHETFRTYLAAADLGVQLRTASRGETSGTVYDCLNYSLPLIVNANGSMAELPADVVCMLPDDFTSQQLSHALESLYQEPEQRMNLGQNGRSYLLRQHQPSKCASCYAEVIEQGRNACYADPQHIARDLACEGKHELISTQARALTLALAYSHPPHFPWRSLFIDVTATVQNDLHTGIQRVVKSVTHSLLHQPPAGVKVYPVYLSNEGEGWHYRHAHRWAFETLLQTSGCPLRDEAVEIAPEDTLLLLDYTGSLAIEAANSGLFTEYRLRGAAIQAVVYDLLPVQMPEVFPPCQFGFRDWLTALCEQVDRFVCISKSVADELHHWLRQVHKPVNDVEVDWFHLGADIQTSVPSCGLKSDEKSLVAALNDHTPCFLMVGTIEPRKGHLGVLDAFEHLWQNGTDVKLVIVGREGWRDLPDSQRRTIPQIVSRLQTHPEKKRRLFWFQDASDELLEKLYALSTCLIAASKGEGFGLPLIEAAAHGLPIIARDIGIFREVAGQYASYFPASGNPEELAGHLQHWLSLYRTGDHPDSRGLTPLSWEQSAAKLAEAVLGPGGEQY